MAQRKSGHVTLLDVARACELSVSTVSIVLSEAPLSKNVASNTKLRIREMAQQLGYHPDDSARSLRRALEVRSLPSPYEVMNIVSDIPYGRFSNQRAKLLLDWEPRDAMPELWKSKDKR